MARDRDNAEAAEPATPPKPREPRLNRAAAAGPRRRRAGERASGRAAAAKPEFGIDLGGAASIEALRIHWVA